MMVPASNATAVAVVPVPIHPVPTRFASPAVPGLVVPAVLVAGSACELFAFVSNVCRVPLGFRTGQLLAVGRDLLTVDIVRERSFVVLRGRRGLGIGGRSTRS